LNFDPGDHSIPTMISVRLLKAAIRKGFCVALLLTGGPDALLMSSAVAESKADGLIKQAHAAQLGGHQAEALALATKAIEADPKNPQCYSVRGRIYVDRREHAKAVADFDQAVKFAPQAAEIYQLRGGEHFKLGHFTESIADFDKVIQLMPQREAHHWQRGISYYYAGRFEDGRKQFESHQTVNPNDVENAVWHYLCVARSSGMEKARHSLIDIKGDGRIPMMQVHSLFAGKTTPEEVLSAAKAGHPSAAQLQEQFFYADLYLGLYYEAAGNGKLAREHIFKAAGYNIDHYMGDVARVHAELLRKQNKR
jgi:lipoprotein NlpI